MVIEEIGFVFLKLLIVDQNKFVIEKIGYYFVYVVVVFDFRIVIKVLQVYYNIMSFLFVFFYLQFFVLMGKYGGFLFLEK